MNRFVCFAAAVALGLAAPAPARAEEEKGIFNIQLENDLFINGTDQHYTHGGRIAWLSAQDDVPQLLREWASVVPVFAAQGKLRVSYSLGQNIFTPADITRREPQPEDRPWAGWLYGGIGLVSDTGTRLDNLEINLGVVGPWALAAQTQRTVHKIVDSQQPKGWDNQLENEPGFVLFYERQWRSIVDFEALGLGVDATPHAGVALGNVYTYGAGGLTFRVGRNLPNDYGPPRIRPSLPGSSFFLGGEGYSWYLFAGVEGRAVARDIFLDGNTWQESANVNKKNMVGDAQAGAAFIFDDVRLAFTYIYRTRQYEGQEHPDRFGSVSLSVRF